jgi:hypothetical protein
MTRKTVNVPPDWTPPKRERGPLIAFLNLSGRPGRNEPDDPKLLEQGCRDLGDGTYAPPSRYSHWTRYP